MIVTIDGPAGAGKSSAARMLAMRLGFDFLDTGAMYRAVTLACLRHGFDLTDQTALGQLLESIRLDLPPGRVLLNNEDVSALIRTPQITAASGPIASSPVVRGKLVEMQRRIAAGRNIVCEGRDQGTVVFPDALCKFFLRADPDERARRRHHELNARGETITLDEVLQTQKERDARDAARAIAPMIPAADAILLDSTHMTLDDVVKQMEMEVRGADADAISRRTSTIMTENPPPDSLARMESPLFHCWHEALYRFYHMAFTLGFSLRMQGQRNMLRDGPALVVANHQSFLDPLVIGLVAQRPLVYLARKTLFKNPLFAALIRSLNAVPIDQEGIGKDGIRVVLEQLERGRAVVVFPEGERTPDGAMLPLKPGILLLIKRTKAPIIPVGIAGAYDAWPIWRPLPVPAPLCFPAGPGAISVSLGQPLDPHRFTELPREPALQELFDKIHDEQVRAEKLRRH